MIDLVSQIEGKFQTALGNRLHYKCWQPDTPGKAVLAIVHGWGEHGGRYQNIVGYMAAYGYVVYVFDNQGHGRSPGQRGHIKRWADYRANVRDYVAMIRHQQPNMPIFLMGHSMGALIVLDYVLNQPDDIDGVAVSATLL